RHADQIHGIGTRIELVDRCTVRIDRPRRPGRPGHDAADSPAADNAVDKTIGIAEPRTAAAERKLVNAVRNETMGLVKVSPHIIEPLVAKRPPARERALVIALSIRSIGQSLAEGVVGLE